MNIGAWFARRSSPKPKPEALLPEIVERERREQEDEERERQENVASTAARARAFSAGARWGSGGGFGSRLSGRRSWAEQVLDGLREGFDKAKSAWWQ